MDRPPFLPSPQWHHLKCVDVVSTGVKVDVLHAAGTSALHVHESSTILTRILPCAIDDPHFGVSLFGVFFHQDVKEISGFQELSEDDQALLRKTFLSSNKKRPAEAAGASGSSKKSKTAAKIEEDSDDDVSLLALPLKKDSERGKEGAEKSKSGGAAGTGQSAAEKAADKALKAHNDKLFGIRSKLKSIPSSMLKQVLSHNDVNSSGGDVTLQQRCADIMLHGVPTICPQVKPHNAILMDILTNADTLS